MWDNQDIKANVFSTTDVHCNWIPAKPNKWDKNKSLCLASYLAQHNVGKEKNCFGFTEFMQTLHEYSLFNSYIKWE